MSLFKRSNNDTPALTPDDIHEIIKAGVAANRWNELFERAYTASQEKDEVARLYNAISDVQNAFLVKSIKDIVDSDNAHETARYLDWIDDQRCPKESLRSRVVTHLAATFFASIIMFLVILAGNVVHRTNRDSVEVKMADHVTSGLESSGLPVKSADSVNLNSVKSPE